MRSQIDFPSDVDLTKKANGRARTWVVVCMAFVGIDLVTFAAMGYFSAPVLHNRPSPPNTTETWKPVRFSPSEKLDVGDVYIGHEASLRWTLENISDEPILIERLIATCGCTDVKIDTPEILPGRHATLTGKIRSTSHPKTINDVVHMSAVGRKSGRRKKLACPVQAHFISAIETQSRINEVPQNVGSTPTSIGEIIVENLSPNNITVDAKPIQVEHVQLFPENLQI